MASTRGVPAAVFWLGLVAAVALFVGLGYLGLWLLRDAGGVPSEAYRILVSQPMNLTRIFDILAIALVPASLVLAPVALKETRAVRAFEREEARLRAERPDAVVTPFEGEEGEGLAFDSPAGRTLLLKPERGVGAPRVIEYPSAAAPEAAPAEEPPPDGDERTSPLGS